MISHEEMIQTITHDIMVVVINWNVKKRHVDNWLRYKDEIIAEIEWQLKTKCEG